MEKMSVKIEVNVTVDSINDAKDIAYDLQEILNNNNITNTVTIEDVGKEVALWTNGNAFRKYQGQDKRRHPQSGWRKVKTIIHEID